MFSPKMTTTCLIGVCVRAVSAKLGAASVVRMALVARAVNFILCVPEDVGVPEYFDLVGAEFCPRMPWICMFPRSPLVVFDGVSRHQPLIAAAEWCVPVEVSPLGLQFYAAFMSIYRPHGR
jgi:hypothetical protein